MLNVDSQDIFRILGGHKKRFNGVGVTNARVDGDYQSTFVSRGFQKRVTMRFPRHVRILGATKMRLNPDSESMFTSQGS